MWLSVSQSEIWSHIYELQIIQSWIS
jgi:hypothetical protein